MIYRHFLHCIHRHLTNTVPKVKYRLLYPTTNKVTRVLVSVLIAGAPSTNLPYHNTAAFLFSIGGTELWLRKEIGRKRAPSDKEPAPSYLAGADTY